MLSFVHPFLFSYFVIFFINEGRVQTYSSIRLGQVILMINVLLLSTIFFVQIVSADEGNAWGSAEVGRVMREGVVCVHYILDLSHHTG